MTTTGSGGEPPIAIVELARRNEAFRRELVTGDSQGDHPPDQGGGRRGRGEYRVVFRIDESKHLIVVRRIDHRRDVYRP